MAETELTIAELVRNLVSDYKKASLVCGEGLGAPSSDEAILEMGASLHLPVPDELHELLRLHGGQENIGAGITGLFGEHRLHSPNEVVENHRMYMENCVLGPFTEFPPPFGEWGYWVPELIPFASWDCYGLCIHSERCDVWEFDPGIGLTIHRPSIKAVLLEIADAVRSGREPRLRRKGEAE